MAKATATGEDTRLHRDDEKEDEFVTWEQKPKMASGR